MKRVAALLGGAALIALVIGHVLRDTPGYMVHNPDDTITGDITHYVYWTRLVTLGGVQSAYAGKWPETYAVYPPVTLYAYQLVGTVYRAMEDPAFDPDRAQHSLWLREGIKFVALSWHLLTALGIFVLLLRTVTPTTAATAAGLYAITPAALYDVAHWAQPDGAHSFFSVLAVGWLSLEVRPTSRFSAQVAVGRTSCKGLCPGPVRLDGFSAEALGQLVAPWAALALAALAKPQAWALVPLFASATVRTHGVAGLVRGAIVGAVVSLVVVSPFVASGTLGQLLSLPATVSSVMPFVSADAHNLWWLLLAPRGVDPLFVLDATPLVGPLTYRFVAGALVAATFVFTAWLHWTRRATLAESAALGVLGWFTFTTQAHENHLFFALPLLALAWPSRRWLLAPCGVISVTLLQNMLLHDAMLLEGLGFGIHDPLIEQLRLMNAVANVACCLAWLLWAVLRAPARPPFQELVTNRLLTSSPLLRPPPGP